MDRIQELIDALSDTDIILKSQIARSHHRCKICDQPAYFFRTPFSELEYSISAICQACQDYYYLNGTEG
jgi:hypothetical protein